jgi:hypothetical protein
MTAYPEAIPIQVGFEDVCAGIELAGLIASNAEG